MQGKSAQRYHHGTAETLDDVEQVVAVGKSRLRTGAQAIVGDGRTAP